LCREHAPEAVAALVRGLSDERQYIAAATALLDRGFGKPKITVEGDGAQSITLLHLIAAKGVGETLQAMLDQGVRPPPLIEGEATNGTKRETDVPMTEADLARPALE
jgi:hypothetical protein